MCDNQNTIQIKSKTFRFFILSNLFHEQFKELRSLHPHFHDLNVWNITVSLDKPHFLTI